MNTPTDIAIRRQNLPKRAKYTILSGEGEVGTSRVVTCTPSGLKRIITKEVCGGDRWAMAFEGEPSEGQSVRSLPRIY
jgi:hypothetical protein